MRRRPQDSDNDSVSFDKPWSTQVGDVGIILSGGGARAAYQVGALKALIPYLKNKEHPISVIIGSSIGAINGLVLAACLKEGIEESVRELELMWRERTFRNTFRGSPGMAFLRAIKVAFLQYLSPGPKADGGSVFDPSPLMERVDGVIKAHGGLTPAARAPNLKNVGVMTTVEGVERKPLLFFSSHKPLEKDLLQGASFEICYVDELSAKHGFASAALPSIMPPVEVDTEHGKVRLVDGGISQNVPVDPAVRSGASKIIMVDISGRNWWLDHFGEAHDTRPTWEIPAGTDTFCFRPPDTFVIRCIKPLGPLLKESVAGSRRKFLEAVGPVWPIFSLLKNKLGEEVAYETMSYVALDQDYLAGLIERGYNETLQMLRNRAEPKFEHNETVEKAVKAL